MATQIGVIIGSGDDLLPEGIKPLPETMLNRNYWHQLQGDFIENKQEILTKTII